MTNARHTGRVGVTLALAAAVALAVIALDQWTKSLAVEYWREPVHLIGPLSLYLVYNSGVAFSVGTGFGLPIVLVVLFVLGIYAIRGRHALNRPIAVGAALIAGGALSNLGDRLFRGHGGSVVDFIYTSFWPTFNLADSAVVCGCVVLFVCYWRSGRRRGPSAVPAAGRSRNRPRLRTGEPSPKNEACVA